MTHRADSFNDIFEADVTVRGFLFANIPNYIPYVGATTDINLGSKNLTTTGNLQAGGAFISKFGSYTDGLFNYAGSIVGGSSDLKFLYDTQVIRINDGLSYLDNVGKAKFVDVNITSPSTIYNLNHDSFTGFIANEHIDWTNNTDGTKNISSVGSAAFHVGGNREIYLGVEDDKSLDATDGTNTVSICDGTDALNITGNQKIAGYLNIGTVPSGYTTFSFTVSSATGGIVLFRESTTEPAFIVLKDNNATGGQLRAFSNGNGIGLADLNGSYSLKSFSTGKTLFGSNLTATSAASFVHTYEDNSNTSTGNGITIEQDGTGDSTLQFLLTGVKRWMCGIDNSDGDKWKIGSGISDLGSAGVEIDTSNNIKTSGTMTASGYTAGTSAGISATITTAKLTAGGANGSMTFVNGILTAQTAAT